MLPRFVRAACTFHRMEKVGRSIICYRPSGGQNPTPPKTPKKKEKKKTNTNPPLMLSKDGMIESLFPFVKCSQNFPSMFVGHFIQRKFLFRRMRSEARHSQNKLLLQISTILLEKSLVAKRPLSYANVIHENVCVRERATILAS